VKVDWARRAEALQSRSPASRGARFSARLSGQTLAQVEMLTAVPAWAAYDAQQRRRLAITSALLVHQLALSCEVRGARLAPLAALAGEALLDAIAAEPAAGAATGGDLPLPPALVEEGTVLLDAALREAIGESGGRGTLALVRRAHALVEANT